MLSPSCVAQATWAHATEVPDIGWHSLQALRAKSRIAYLISSVLLAGGLPLETRAPCASRGSLGSRPGTGTPAPRLGMWGSDRGAGSRRWTLRRVDIARVGGS